VNLSPFVFLVIIATIISIMGRQIARSRNYRQRGDTIVEVLIATVIIATILGGAFVVAQSSSHMVQSSQEHGHGLLQIQGQTELLRSLAFSGDPTLKGYTAGKKFCAYIAADKSVQLLDNGGQVQCDSGSSNGTSIYKIVDTLVSVGDPTKPADMNTYKLEVTWDKLGGGTNHESLIYGVKIK
jgi:type II secretory pathway pseudopilin PulG